MKRLLDIYSKAAGIARALITVLAAFLVLLTTAGPLAHTPLIGEIAVVVTAAIQVLTRFTDAGNTPPTPPVVKP